MAELVCPLWTKHVPEIWTKISTMMEMIAGRSAINTALLLKWRETRDQKKLDFEIFNSDDDWLNDEAMGVDLTPEGETVTA
jgi:hypothetical protein